MTVVICLREVIWELFSVFVGLGYGGLRDCFRARFSGVLTSEECVY